LLAITVIAIIVAGGFYMYRRAKEPEPAPRADLTDADIKQGWRKLGFYCELDNQKKLWTLTGSRAGLLYFPDLLLGYVNDPKHATNGEKEHYGPYGSLEVMTWEDAGFDGHAIRGSLGHLTHLAELVESKLAFAQPGEPIRIREEYAQGSPYSLLLDVRVDGFDPASADRDSLGAIQSDAPPKPPKPAT
jgi:hypothetical protein